MIEIISKEGKGGESGKSFQENIKLPRNIKQIGEGSAEKKIYIEDYVYGYMKSLKQAAVEEQPQMGVLMGRIVHNEKESYTFIRGAVLYGEERENKEVVFNEKIWSVIYNDIDKFFPDMEIVGWFGIFESIGEELVKKLAKIHIDHFAGRMKTLFLIGISEEEENFYLYEDGKLAKQPGYIQFYEKNTEMQEYIVAVRGQVSCEVPEGETVVRNFRSLIQEKQEDAIKKKTLSLAYGMGTFMIVVILIIGVNMMNSYDKMNQFDRTLKNLIQQLSGGNNQGDKTNVIEVVGNVYPTGQSQESPTQSQEPQSSSQEQNPSEAESQSSPSQEAPEPQESETPVSATLQDEIYIVKKGDSLMGICRNYYGSLDKLEELAAYNQIENIDKIYVGQEIKLP